MNRLLYIILLLLLSSCMDPEVKPRIIFDERTGVEINFEVKENIFPDSWYKSPINGYAKSLDFNEHDRSETLIKEVLEKYPESLIRRNLEKIHVLKYLEFYDVSYGGTNSSDAVYITNNGISSGYTDLFIKQAFHHELSSIFLRNYDIYFNENQWKSINPENFNYGSGGVEEIRTGKSSQIFDDSLNAIGFLSIYSMSSLENDLNNFAQHFFEPSDEFRDILLKYEPLQKKAKLFKLFYQNIDPSFNIDFWNSLNVRDSNKSNYRSTNKLPFPPLIQLQ